MTKMPSSIEFYKSLIKIHTISNENKFIDQSNKNFIYYLIIFPI